MPGPRHRRLWVKPFAGLCQQACLMYQRNIEQCHMKMARSMMMMAKVLGGFLADGEVSCSCHMWQQGAHQ